MPNHVPISYVEGVTRSSTQALPDNHIVSLGGLRHQLVRVVVRTFLQISPRAGGSISLALAVLISAFLWLSEVVPAPLSCLPALVAGWARCRPAFIAVIVAGSAFSSTLPTQFSLSLSAQMLAFAFVLAALSAGAALARRAYDNERLAARSDTLTGCLNLRGFHGVLGSRLAEARNQEKPVALAYIDLDHFKDVNDRAGHAAGDQLLRTFATGLKDRLLPQDVVGRLGGDEFAVLLAEVHGPCAIQRLQQIVSDLLLSQNYGVTASIGALVIEPGAIVSQSELIVMTDSLKYEAKRAGKGTVRAYVVAADVTVRAELAA